MYESKRTVDELDGLQLPSQALSITPSDVALQQSDTSSKSPNQTKSVHAFRVGSLGIILPENTISEIVDDLSICRIPNTSNVLFGVTSLRGSVVPVFHLQQLLSIDQIDPSYILIIGSGEKSVGVLLDALPRQLDVGQKNKYNTIPPLPEPIHEYAKNAYYSDGLWVDCDLFGFFKSLSSRVA